MNNELKFLIYNAPEEDVSINAVIKDDPDSMPKPLSDAHIANDRAVMQAYGFWGKLNTKSECIAALMKMYQEKQNEQ